MNLKSGIKKTVFILSFLILYFVLGLYCCLGLYMQNMINKMLSRTYELNLLYDILFSLYRHLYLVISLVFSVFVYKYFYKSKIVFIVSNILYIILSVLLFIFLLYQTNLFNTVYLYPMLKISICTGLYNIIFFLACDFIKSKI